MVARGQLSLHCLGKMLTPDSLELDPENIPSLETTNQLNIVDHAKPYVMSEIFLTSLPTLQQQIEKSQWGCRGWTLQEALLSPRCLYFTYDQLYFQCNLAQCCESLRRLK